MKFINIHTVISLTVVTVMSVSCIGGYMDINRNEYGVTDDEMQRDGYAVKAALIGISNGVISPDVNTTQFTECLLGGTMAGYLADANNGFPNTISNYNPTDDWTRVFMASDRIIPVIYSNYNKLHQVTDDPVILAVGDIIKVAAMHRVTDTYGPVPYSKIGQNGEINVPYDSQETVYKTMIDELENAVEVMMPMKNEQFSAGADVIFGGKISKWIKYANSLKLRLAMRMSYADPEYSRAAAESAVAHEVGVMESNDDNVKFSSWGTDGNPINVSVEYNMLTTHDDKTKCTTEGGDSHVAADIICYMNGYGDPRRAAYFTRSEFTGEELGTETAVEYIGLHRCIVIPEHGKTGHKFSGVKVGKDDAAYWMNAAEVAFLKAEAAGVFGYDMGVDAQSAYEKGVRLSFEQWGVSGADAYLADNTSVPASNVVIGNVPGGVTGSDITIAWNAGADPEEMQERIITQKWIANWLLGNEAWADWRRTGYPRLLPGDQDGNYSGIKDYETVSARRMCYPLNEAAFNPYCNQAVDEYLNQENALNTSKGDKMLTRLWFDAKPNNPTYQK